MKLIRDETSELTLKLSEAQIRVLMACIRESFATIGKAEYELRVGVPIQAASQLAEELFALMNDAGVDQ